MAAESGRWNELLRTVRRTIRAAMIVVALDAFVRRAKNRFSQKK
jgi:hypothetical protein